MNNILEAYSLIRFIKSVNKNATTVVYGEAASCNPSLFGKLNEVDYVIGNGQIEYGLESVLIREMGADLAEFADFVDNNCHLKLSIKSEEWLFIHIPNGIG